MSKQEQGGMLSQLRQMKDRLEQAQQELASEMVEVTSGGGKVRVKMSGTQECHAVQIAPDLIESGDLGKLEQLLMLAVNQAIHESQVVAARKLGPMAGGLPFGRGGA